MIHDIAAAVRRSLKPGQYAHITIEIGPKPEPPEPRWKVGDKCDPLDPPPIGTWVWRLDWDDFYGAKSVSPATLKRVYEGIYPWHTGATWRHAWIAQPPPGERQPWEVE